MKRPNPETKKPSNTYNENISGISENFGRWAVFSFSPRFSTCDATLGSQPRILCFLPDLTRALTRHERRFLFSFALDSAGYRSAVQGVTLTLIAARVQPE
jgi:hypothetical protein